MDMEFVTYAGFDIVGSAFERIALIFATDNYLGLFISFAVLGVIFASIAASVRNFTGQTVTVQAWAIPILLGLVAFQGLMLPKGKVLLYDPVKNDSRVIGDVPQAVVLVAGLFNLIERGVVDAVDLASTSIYADDATGISFSLLHEAAQRPLNVADSFTTKTLSAYIKNCAPVALNSPNSPLSEALVKRGTHDLRDALAGMALPALATLVFNAQDKSGFPVSCQEAWNTHLSPALQDTQFRGAERALCAAVGFDPDRVTQLTRCRDRMQTAMTRFGVPVGTYSAGHFARNFYLAQNFAVAIQGNPDLATLTLANRNTLIEGVGMYAVASDWLPQIRAMMTAIALAMIPMLALFLVTPLASKAAFFLLGLFGWLTLWGVTDAILHDMSMTAAAAFWENTRQLGFALDGIYRSSDASAQSLALLGKSKTYSITIASVIAMAVWRFGGYAFSQMTENWSQHLEQAGASAALKTQTPEGSAQTLSTLTDSMATHALHQNLGPSALAQDNFMNRSTAAQSTQQLTGFGAFAKQSLNQVAGALGSVQAGQRAGSLEATRDLSGDNKSPEQLANTARAISYSQGVAHGAGALTKQAVISEAYGDLPSGIRAVTDTETHQRVASAQVTQDMLELEQTLTGNSDTDETYAHLARYQRLPAFVEMLASDGNPYSGMSTQANQHSIRLAQTDALVDAASDLGYSPAEVGRIMGTFDATGVHAKADALEAMSPTQIALGYLANHLRHGLGGDQLQKIAAEHGHDLPSFLNSAAGIEASRTMAQVLKTDFIAETLAESSEEAVLRQEGAINTVSLSGDAAHTFADYLQQNSLITDEQYQWMKQKSANNEAIQATYALDITQGEAGNVRLFAGHQVVDDQSTTINTGATVRQGLNTDDQSVFQAFTQFAANDAGGFQLRNQIFQDFDADGQLNDAGTVAILPRLDQALSTFGNSAVSEFDQTRVSGSLNAQVAAGASAKFNTKDNIIGKVASLISAASAEAYVSTRVSAGTEASGSTGSSEDLRFSNFSVQALEAMTHSLGVIDSELTEKGLSVHAEDAVQRNDAEMYRHQRFTELMSPFIGQYIDELRRVGKHNMEDSDQAHIVTDFKDQEPRHE